jgi:hypothetical protein
MGREHSRPARILGIDLVESIVPMMTNGATHKLNVSRMSQIIGAVLLAIAGPSALTQMPAPQQTQ